MIEKLKVDIPQLTVKYNSSSYCTNKEHLDIGRNYFLWHYLRQKQTEYAVRHANINELLRFVYLNHQKNRQRRQEETDYLVDTLHYDELDKISTISFLVVKLVKELVAIIYFMNYLNLYKDYPIGTIENKWQKISAEPHLSKKLTACNPFIEDIEVIDKASNSFNVHPNDDLLILDDEPTIMIYHYHSGHIGSINKKNLKEFIYSYNNFFKTTQEVLKECSPEAISIGLQ